MFPDLKYEEMGQLRPMKITGKTLGLSQKECTGGLSGLRSDEIVALLQVVELILHESLCGEGGKATADENNIRNILRELFLHLLNRYVELWIVSMIADPDQEAVGKIAVLHK